MSSNVFIGIASEFDNKGFKQAEKATSALDKQAAKLGKTLLAAFSGQKILQYSKASVLAYSEDRRAAEAVLNAIAQINPYRRDQANMKSEFYLFQMGFLAAYLASVFRDDPLRRRDFIKHIERLRYPKH